MYFANEFWIISWGWVMNRIQWGALLARRGLTEVNKSCLSAPQVKWQANFCWDTASLQTQSCALEGKCRSLWRYLQSRRNRKQNLNRGLRTSGDNITFWRSISFLRRTQHGGNKIRRLIFLQALFKRYATACLQIVQRFWENKFATLVVFIMRRRVLRISRGPTQERNEVKWRPGQEASFTPPCSNLRPVGSKCAVEESTCDIVGTFRRHHIASASGELCPHTPSLRPWSGNAHESQVFW